MADIYESSSSKTWWAAVWRGLVVDETGKHHAAMKGALWLFIYLILHADRKNGTLFRRYQTIAQDMHVNPRTVRKIPGDLERLQLHRGYSHWQSLADQYSEVETPSLTLLRMT